MKTHSFFLTTFTLYALFFACGNNNEQATAEQNTAKTVQAAAKDEQTKITWYKDWNEGMEVAKKVQKPVFVDLYADWCTWCKKMDKETFSDAEVIKRLGTEWIGIKVDTMLKDKSGTVYVNTKEKTGLVYLKEDKEGFEKNTIPYNQLPGVFGASGLPAFLFIDKDGHHIYTNPGFIPAADFAPMLDYFREEQYKKNVNFEEYKKSKS